MALSKKKGITLPRDPRTFPYLTQENLVSRDPARTLPATISLSEHNFVSAEVVLTKKVSVTFEQAITRGDEVLCKSTVRIACLDAKTLRPKEIPENLLELLKNEH